MPCLQYCRHATTHQDCEEHSVADQKTFENSDYAKEEMAAALQAEEPHAVENSLAFQKDLRDNPAHAWDDARRTKSKTQTQLKNIVPNTPY